MKTSLSIALAFVLCSAAHAEEPAAATDAGAAAAPAMAPDAGTAAAEKKDSGDRPYVSSAVAFLKGLIHSSRTGDAGEQGWVEATEHAGDKVTLTVAGKDVPLDIAAKKSDAQFIRFQKVSTLRDGNVVTGVTLESLELKTPGGAHSGRAKLKMSEAGGKWLVTAIEVE
jgi:hypothetical protein